MLAASTGPLDPGKATTVNIAVEIPVSPGARTDTFTLTVTSESEPAVSAQAHSTTVLETWFTYLPIILKK